MSCWSDPRCVCARSFVTGHLYVCVGVLCHWGHAAVVEVPDLHSNVDPIGLSDCIQRLSIGHFYSYYAFLFSSLFQRWKSGTVRTAVCLVFSYQRSCHPHAPSLEHPLLSPLVVSLPLTKSQTQGHSNHTSAPPTPARSPRFTTL